MNPVLVGEADKVKVFDLVEHLRKAFESFFDQSRTVQPHDYSRVDIFMAIHNFHKLAVLNLVQDAGFTVVERDMFLKMAADTFEMAMNAERKKGEPHGDGTVS